MIAEASMDEIVEGLRRECDAAFEDLARDFRSGDVELFEQYAADKPVLEMFISPAVAKRILELRRF